MRITTGSHHATISVMFVVLVTLTTPACRPPPIRLPPALAEAYWPKGPVGFYKGHTVVMPESAVGDPDRQIKLLDAVAVHIDTYSAFEFSVPPTVIGITDTKTFPGETDPAVIYVGCWLFPRSNAVLCWAGDLDEVPALYHELHHRVTFLRDHNDPSWIRVFYEWQNVLSALKARKAP